MAPRASSTTRSGVIELSIPMRLVRNSATAAASSDDEDSGDLTCYICANTFCDDDECCRSMTHLECCTQSICCGCLLKQTFRCGCKEDCDAVVSLCPFCREVSPVERLDVFLGTKSPCADCVRGDNQTPAPQHQQPPRETSQASSQVVVVSRPVIEDMEIDQID